METDGRPDLEPDAIVVRGGVMSVESVRRRVLKDSARLRRRTGIRYGLSAAADSIPLSELVARAPIPHPELQKTTVRRLREAGFTIEPTFAYPHCTINLGGELTDEVVRNLIEAFDPPEERPTANGS